MAQAFDRGFSEVLALFQASRLNEARVAAAALIAAHPNAAAGHNICGVIHASLGDPTEAAAAFRKAAALDPRWDEPHTNLGLLLCQQKDFARAAESFRAALALKPANTGAALGLGNALRELGRGDEACASYREVLARGGPDQALAHNNLGAILFDQGKSEEAAASFARAIALQPKLADAHLNQGRVLRQLGRLDEALQSLRQAASLAPQSAETAVVLANTYRDLGRLPDAAEAYRRALAIKPGDREAAYNLGLTLNALGHHGEGLATIARGPGIARLSTRAPGDAATRRITIGAGPTFIGGWSLKDPSLCDALISTFENNRVQQIPGRTGLGIDTSVKNSTDLTVMPADLHKPELAPVAAYLKELESCVSDYAVQWPHFGGMLGQVDVVPFTLQRYTAGGHFQKPHAERMAFGYMHRVLAWMTYLNDVPEGGATTFHHYGIAVKPARGKTLIWPAEWTHVHAGEVVPSGTKYIITGWMHFPHPG